MPLKETELCLKTSVGTTSGGSRRHSGIQCLQPPILCRQPQSAPQLPPGPFCSAGRNERGWARPILFRILPQTHMSCSAAISFFGRRMHCDCGCRSEAKYAVFLFLFEGNLPSGNRFCAAQKRLAEVQTSGGARFR